ncbi:MAG: C2 domain-containing protein [Planctomycetota bacterium]|nr:C2 domain-containing protein [Planctomycetota bacterium]MDI6787923.1 C2 domain-containing protein [Planctomycetota bacterium]
MGSKAAPPDCFIIVRQNDNEIFKPRVKPDTRNPKWNEEFILNWAENSKLELILYDLDGRESETILTWDNTTNKGFLFKDKRLTTSAGSYLSYEVFLTPIKKE